MSRDGYYFSTRSGFSVPTERVTRTDSEMFKSFSCKALLCLSFITVLLLLVEYRYAFFSDYLHLDSSDNIAAKGVKTLGVRH